MQTVATTTDRLSPKPNGQSPSILPIADGPFHSEDQKKISSLWERLSVSKCPYRYPRWYALLLELRSSYHRIQLAWKRGDIRQLQTGGWPRLRRVLISPASPEVSGYSVRVAKGLHRYYGTQFQPSASRTVWDLIQALPAWAGKPAHPDCHWKRRNRIPSPAEACGGRGAAAFSRSSLSVPGDGRSRRR